MAVSTFEGLSTGAVSAAAAGFDQVVVPSGGSAVVSTSNPYRGTQCLVCTTGSAGGTCYTERTALLGAASTGQVFGRARFRVPVLPGDTTGMRLLVVTDGPGAFAGDVRVSNLGKLQLRSGAGTLLATSALTLTADQWVDVGLAVLVFSATVGQIQMQVWDSGGVVSETLTSTATLNTLNAGGTNKAQAGAVRSGLNGFAVAVDDVDWSTAGWPTLVTDFTTAPDGLSIPTALGAPTTSQLVTSVPDGLAVPVALGAPSAGWAATSAPDGQAVPVALGAPSSSWSATCAPDGLVVPAAVGDPVAGWSGATFPDGLSVPVALGVPGASQPGMSVSRPYSGVTGRPATGVVARPSVGVVVRP